MTTFDLIREGAFWKDAGGNFYAWSDDDAPQFTNVETGEAVVLVEVISEDKVLVC